MAIKSARDFFVDELRDLYSAEKQAIRAYPKLAKSVSSPQLKEALQTHLQETKAHLERLDRVFEVLEKRSGGKTCEAMKGLVKESSEALDEIGKGPILDAALIACGQRMEHHEIAAYGTVLALAKAMREDEIGQLLSRTLEEEKATDEKLTQVSETVNKQAIGDDEEDEDEEEVGVDEDEDEKPPVKAAAKKAASKLAAKGTGKRK